MFRAQTTPTANLYLSRKWDMIEYETHRYNVRHMKSRLDIKSPRTFTNTFVKPNKLQSELERVATIQRDNMYFLNRLATIKRQGGWTDNKNFHVIRSLNTTSRQKEMVDLSHANKIMLARIRDTHTSYNRSKMEGEYLLQQKQKAIALKYPQNWREIRDKIKEERAEIRRKYVYPRVGVFVKKGTKSNKSMRFGDGTDVKRPEDKNCTSLGKELNRTVNDKKFGRENAEILTEKGENPTRKNKKFHQSGIKCDTKKGATTSKFLNEGRNVANAAFKKPEEQILDSEIKNNSSSENMGRDSGVDIILERTTNNGKDSDSEVERKGIFDNE